MEPQLRISVVDPDPDYLCLEIHASSDRFAGTTRIYACNEELDVFCRVIEGFPARIDDRRSHLFGARGSGSAGGFCALQFTVIDGCGHARIDIEMGDDSTWHPAGFSSFTIPTLAAEIDAFVEELRRVSRHHAGEARLKRSVFGTVRE